MSTRSDWPQGVLNRERTLQILREHNAWRRGAEGPQTDSRMLGLALDAAIEALASAPQPPSGGEVWQHPDTLPPVESGQYGWFWVAVRRTNGRVYSFPATYLNAMVLTDENGDQEESRGNRYHHGPVDQDDGTFEATGWHDAKEHSEYSAIYLPLLDSDKDELIAWRSVADYGDTAPPSAPVGVEAALRDALQGLIDFIEIDKLPMDADAMFIAKRALAQQPAPPSAPVGVEGHVRGLAKGAAKLLRQYGIRTPKEWCGLLDDALGCVEEIERTLAQQPAASPLDAVLVPVPVAGDHNGNVQVIEAARDAFPVSHPMYAALDHAAAELAALDTTVRRAQQPAAVDGAMVELRKLSALATQGELVARVIERGGQIIDAFLTVPSIEQGRTIAGPVPMEWLADDSYHEGGPEQKAHDARFTAAAVNYVRALAAQPGGVEAPPC